MYFIKAIIYVQEVCPCIDFVLNFIPILLIFCRSGQPCLMTLLTMCCLQSAMLKNGGTSTIICKLQVNFFNSAATLYFNVFRMSIFFSYLLSNTNSWQNSLSFNFNSNTLFEGLIWLCSAEKYIYLHCNCTSTGQKLLLCKLLIHVLNLFNFLFHVALQNETLHAKTGRNFQRISVKFNQNL